VASVVKIMAVVLPIASYFCISVAAESANFLSPKDVQQIFRRNDFPAAVQQLRLLADDGSGYAQFWMGMLYEYGNGVPTDYVEAAKGYRLGAESGDAGAQVRLAGLYQTGQGVPFDQSEVVKWYLKAAEQGNLGAQWNLSAMYLYGEGLPQYYYEASKWFPASNDNLGYALDPVGEEDRIVARAQGGSPLAQSELGWEYYTGGGSVLQDYAEALKWFQLAADQEEPVAMHNLVPEAVAQNRPSRATAPPGALA
jgi:TPR repeat protein